MAKYKNKQMLSDEEKKSTKTTKNKNEYTFPGKNPLTVYATDPVDAQKQYEKLVGKQTKENE